jgi:CRP-like cAMP-binding protein
MANPVRISSHAPTSNLLLNLTRPATRMALFPQLERIEMPLGSKVYDEREEQNFVYFPSSGIVSLLYMMRNGNSAEMAIVGSEGLVGFAALLGGLSTTTRAVVQVAGDGFRLKRRILDKIMDSDPMFRRLMLRYTQSLLTQFAQTAVCNRHHSVEQQWCRWILLTLDRSAAGQIKMTQQLIADMLGVRREGVSAVANSLKADGVVDYSRGVIDVIDRDRIEERVCECYGLIVEETERLLPGSTKRLPPKPLPKVASQL